jgi:hypothetical protein
MSASAVDGEPKADLAALLNGKEQKRLTTLSFKGEAHMAKSKKTA